MLLVLALLRVAEGQAERVERGVPPILDLGDRGQLPEDNDLPETTAELASGPPLLHAYDCSDARAQTRAIDLTAPADCPDPERDYTGPHLVQAAIVKKRDSVPHPVVHCEVRVTRQVNYCYGLLSTSFGMVTTAYKKLVLLDRETCVDAVAHRRLKFEGKEFELPKARSEKMYTSYFSRGWVDRSAGACYPEAFALPDGTYASSAVEETRIEILARTVRGLWNMESGEIVVDDHLPGVFRQMRILDAHSGAYYWADEDTAGACALTLTQVFMGKAKLWIPNANKDRTGTTEQYSGATLVVDSKNASQSVALLLGQPVLYCEVAECFVADNMPGFAACFRMTKGQAEQTFTGSVGPEKNHTSGLTYDLIVRDAEDEGEWNRALAWSRSDFMDFVNLAEYQETMVELVRAQCELERKVLYNKLQAMSGNANPHALVDILGPGHSYVRVGSSVAYVTQCTHVLVEMKSSPNCSLEVPVTRQGSKKMEWMDPLTKVLNQYPTEVLCSTLLPVRWRLDGNWYCATPEPMICAAPSKLKPTLGKYTATLELFDKAGKSPLMQASQIERRDRLYNQLSHREPVLVRVVQNALDRAAGTGHIDNILSAQEVEGLTSAISRNVVGWIGPYWLMDWFGVWAVRLWALLTFCLIVGSWFKNCGMGAITFLQNGWDGGRTLVKVAMAMCNCFYLPKHMWDYVLAGNESTWHAIRRFFERVQRYRDGKADPEEARRTEAEMEEYRAHTRPRNGWGRGPRNADCGDEARVYPEAPTPSPPPTA